MIQSKYLDYRKNKNSHTFLARTQTHPASVEISMELCPSYATPVCHRDAGTSVCTQHLLIAAKLQSQSRAEGLRKCAVHTQWTISVIKKNKVMDIIASVNWGCLQITNIICYLLYLGHRNICIYKYTLCLFIYL